MCQAFEFVCSILTSRSTNNVIHISWSRIPGRRYKVSQHKRNTCKIPARTSGKHARATCCVSKIIAYLASHGVNVHGVLTSRAFLLGEIATGSSRLPLAFPTADPQRKLSLYARFKGQEWCGCTRVRVCVYMCIRGAFSADLTRGCSAVYHTATTATSYSENGERKRKEKAWMEEGEESSGGTGRAKKFAEDARVLRNGRQSTEFVSRRHRVYVTLWWPLIFDLGSTAWTLESRLAVDNATQRQSQVARAQNTGEAQLFGADPLHHVEANRVGLSGTRDSVMRSSTWSCYFTVTVSPFHVLQGGRCLCRRYHSSKAIFLLCIFVYTTPSRMQRLSLVARLLLHYRWHWKCKKRFEECSLKYRWCTYRRSHDTPAR